MAKLSKVKNNKPIPIGVEGIYINNMPAQQLQELFWAISSGLKDEPARVLVDLFERLICDEDGVAFEDAVSYDEILAVLSVKDIQEIMQGIADTMNPTANDLGK